MKRSIAVATSMCLAMWLLGTGCKGETVTRDNPETAAALDECRAKVKDLDELRALLEKDLAQFKLGATTNAVDDAVVVTIDGDLLNVTAGAGKGPYRGEPKGNAKDEALYEEFVKAVKLSRGAIKKCYQSALKKNNSLQARTVSLRIQVDFLTSGRMSSATFNPRISDTFDKCMIVEAQKWKLPAAPRKVSFQYKMSLTPE